MSLIASPAPVPLIDAVRQADKVAVRDLLKDKATDVNAPGPDGTTALHWAVDRRDLDLVDARLRQLVELLLREEPAVRVEPDVAEARHALDLLHDVEQVAAEEDLAAREGRRRRRRGHDGTDVHRT